MTNYDDDWWTFLVAVLAVAAGTAIVGAIAWATALACGYAAIPFVGWWGIVFCVSWVTSHIRRVL